MNDAGLDEPIQNASSQVKDTYRNQSTRGDAGDSGISTSDSQSNSEALQYQPPAYSQPPEDARDASYTMPTKWWYASTGFPLITGTFGPMANAFSICALVENWREDVPPGTNATEDTGINIPDPKWLIAVNAVSLVFALIANMSLLLNMARRLKFSIAQPITIIGFWASSVLLIGLISVASYDFKAPGVQNQILTQAYYYACWAAGLYQLISYLMCVTLYGAMKKKYDHEFKLTMAQRTLMLQTIFFLAYLLLGALVYCKIEGWKYLDAVYWADFTLLTVGIGDYAPATHLGRSLLFPFAIGGIVILGLVVSSIRSLVLDRGKKKVSARMTEKARRRVVKQTEAMRNNEKTRKRTRTGLDSDTMKKLAAGPQDDPDKELTRRKAEFDAMRKVQELSERRQKWMNLLVSTSAFAVLWFIGAVIFWETEMSQQEWTYFQSLYFSYTSLLTIGYGDLSPVSNSGKPFFVFWSLLAIPSLTILISDMGDTVVKGIKDLSIWLGEVTILPSDQGSVLERLEYGVFKATGGVGRRARKQNNSEEDSDSDDDDDDDEPGELPPGFVRLFKTSDKKKKKKKDTDPTDRIAADFEDSERHDEHAAHDKGDKIAEDEHQYRHLLISQIRKVYADSNLATPKRYDYKDWTFFLRLLGEDESSSEFHRAARIRNNQRGRSSLHSSSTDRNEATQAEVTSPENKDIQRWSWIGQHSPLMTEKSEPDLILEMLFKRLEESLSGINKEKEAVAADNSNQDGVSKDHQPIEDKAK